MCINFIRSKQISSFHNNNNIRFFTVKVTFMKIVKNWKVGSENRFFIILWLRDFICYFLLFTFSQSPLPLPPTTSPISVLKSSTVQFFHSENGGQAGSRGHFPQHRLILTMILISGVSHRCDLVVWLAVPSHSWATGECAKPSSVGWLVRTGEIVSISCLFCSMMVPSAW